MVDKPLPGFLRNIYALVDEHLDAGHFTISDLCRRAGISRTSYYQWRNHGRLPTVEKLAQLQTACAELTLLWVGREKKRIADEIAAITPETHAPATL